MDSEDQLKTTVTLGFVSRFPFFGETGRWEKDMDKANEDKRRLR